MGVIRDALSLGGDGGVRSLGGVVVVRVVLRVACSVCVYTLVVEQLVSFRPRLTLEGGV